MRHYHPEPAQTAAIDPVPGWFAGALRAERDALDSFLAAPPATIPQAVAAIVGGNSPLACIGVGKSGHVAHKIAATFSSLGTPACFVNAAEAAHGDLGAVRAGATVLLFSNSGTTAEIMRILPTLTARGCVLIGVVGNVSAPLARAAHVVIEARVAAEADHIGLAPTASTTLQMAIGDALAVAVSRLRGFTREDFLGHHPAGLLGRQALPVRDLMRQGAELPCVSPSASLADLLAAMSEGRMGAACVVDDGGTLIGLVVDGDIRRHFQAGGDVHSACAGDIMQRAPRVIHDDATLGDALRMQDGAASLLVIPVVDRAGRLMGLLHTGDMVRG